MDREKLQKAMARRHLRKEQDASPDAEKTYSSMSVDDIQQNTNSSIFEVNYLNSRQLASTLEAAPAAKSKPSPDKSSQYDPKGREQSFREMDKNLEDLESELESFTSAQPSRRVNSEQRPTGSRRLAGSEIESYTSEVYLDDETSFSESTSYISVPGDSAPEVQYKASPPKGLPKPEAGESRDNKQSTSQYEQIIAQLQQDCDKEAREIRRLQEEVPADSKQQKMLIKQMGTELKNQRDMLERQEQSYTEEIKELTQQIEVMKQQESEHVEIINAVNQIVTGQYREFDFESLVAILESKFSRQEEPGEEPVESYIKRLKEAAENERVLKRTLEEKQSEYMRLELKYEALEMSVETQGKFQPEQPKQVLSKSTAKTPSGVKQEIEQRDAEIGRLKAELANAHALMAAEDPLGTQDVFRSQLRQAEEAVEQLTFKQEAQEEEYERRMQAFSENEQQTVARVRDGYENRLKDAAIKLEDAEAKKKAAEELSAAWERRFEKLNAQYEQEEMAELQKRITQIEQNPPSQALKDVMERVVKAEGLLEEERRRFQLVCKEKSLEIADFKAELAEILNAIAAIGV